jgi:ATP-dependent DNA helicase DinG
MSDKGVVAVLDPKLTTAASCAPHPLATYDPEVVRAARKRLDAAQSP